MASPVEQIKERLDITDVVGSYVKLEKAGNNYKARCPFHNERTPSFFVSPTRQTYHCFGCSQGGDMFSFVQEFEGIDFAGALKILADRAGVKLGERDRKQESERAYLFRITEAATQFYEKQLASNADAMQYLTDRGVAKETIADFRLGFAPSGWQHLTSFFAKKEVSVAQVEKAGLALPGNRGHYDRFRGRIMFPITDSSGRVVGFSGRVLPGTEEADRGESAPSTGSTSSPQAGSGQAKYINTPETPLFDKSRVLYGFDKAKHTIRKEGVCVVVEGQMDVVMSHQAGITNVVATSGTALSRAHLQLIKRLADRIIFAFDADSAGLQASQRGIALALSEGFDVAIGVLPEGSDPADLAREDVSKWQTVISEARHVISFLIHAATAHTTDAHTRFKYIRDHVLPYLAQLPSSMEQAHFVKEIAEAGSVAEGAVWDELKHHVAQHSTQQHAHPVDADARDTDEDAKPDTSLIDRIIQNIAGILWWQEASEQEGAIDTSPHWSELARILAADDYEALKNTPEDEKKEYIFQAEVSYEAHTDIAHELTEQLRHLEREVLRAQFAEAMNALKEAETQQNTERVQELLETCQTISQKLRDIAHT